MSHAKPYVVKAGEWEAEPDDLSPGCTIAAIVEGERQNSGLYFIPPGVQTNVFSIEDEDDGTAPEWYGPCDEFYYMLAGDELTMYWGKNTDAIAKGETDCVVLRPGDMAYWSRGWKYSVKNTGNAPATFLWGLTMPVEKVGRRDATTGMSK